MGEQIFTKEELLAQLKVAKANDKNLKQQLFLNGRMLIALENELKSFK